MLPIPSRESLESTLDTLFRFHPLEGSDAFIEARLVEVGLRRAPAGHEQFALLFVGPKDPAATQGTYRVSHATLGEFPLFTTPVGPGRDGLPRYEAIISRELAA